MSSIERSQTDNGQNIVEIVALVLAEKIKASDLSENDRTVFNYYGTGGVMDDDFNFKKQVNARTIQILENSSGIFINQNIGKKIPLFTPEELKNARRHKKHKIISNEKVLQPQFWPLEPSDKNIFGPENVLDAEKKLFNEIKNIDNRFYPHKKTILTEDIKQKRIQLREKIDLPIARGKDPHINDAFYKYLVRRIYFWDTFGIFREFDRVLGETPIDLQKRIDQVKETMGRLLDDGLSLNDKYLRFHEFAEKYGKDWGMEVVLNCRD